MTDEATPLAIAYNQDPGVLFSETAEPIRPAHVDEMVDEVADASVDALYLNVNMWRTNYPSDVWQTWWDGFEAWAEERPPLETSGMERSPHWGNPRHPKRYHMIRQMERLADQGCDYVGRALDRCVERGVTPGVSIRMNDRHDVAHPESNYFSDFYRDNPGLRLDADHPSGILGLDYAQEAVRDHVFALIDEVVSRYPVAALELDYLRHRPFFEETNDPGHAATMTGFVERVAERCQRASVDVVPRVPAEPASAGRECLDVGEWVDRGAIDGLTVATPIRVDWQVPVEEWRPVVGDLPLSVSVDKWADDPPGLPKREIPVNKSFLRGIASTYATTSADGLYFFNFFGPRELPLEPTEPRFDILPSLKRPEMLAGEPKTYLATATPGSWGYSTPDLPLSLDPGIARELTLRLIEEPPDVSPRVAVITKRTIAESDLELGVNATTVGSADSVGEYRREGYRGGEPGHGVVATFPLDPDALAPGPNRFVLRNVSEERFRAVGFEVRI